MNSGNVLSPPGYQVDAVLGHGRRSVVYLVREQRSGQRVAMKIARRAHLRALGQPSDFSADFRLLAALAHPNVVQVFGHGTWNDKAFLTMEHAAGGHLVPRAAAFDAAAFLTQAAHGLAALHAHGWVHRDVKPANFLVRSDGSLALADFGSACVFGEAVSMPPGTVTGTPCYAAPEQGEGAAAQPAADVYSLGIVLWEMLCGTPPYPGQTPAELLGQHMIAPVPALPREHAAWQPLLDAMLAKDPGQRPADGRAVLGWLQHTGHPHLLPHGHGRPGGARDLS